VIDLISADNATSDNPYVNPVHQFRLVLYVSDTDSDMNFVPIHILKSLEAKQKLESVKNIPTERMRELVYIIEPSSPDAKSFDMPSFFSALRLIFAELSSLYPHIEIL
jgi:hypothetical protein